MVLYSGKLTERNSACESNIQERMTRGRNQEASQGVQGALHDDDPQPSRGSRRLKGSGRSVYHGIRPLHARERRKSSGRKERSVLLVRIQCVQKSLKCDCDYIGGFGADPNVLLERFSGYEATTRILRGLRSLRLDRPQGPGP